MRLATSVSAKKILAGMERPRLVIVVEREPGAVSLWREGDLSAAGRAQRPWVASAARDDETFVANATTSCAVGSYSAVSSPATRASASRSSR